MLRPLLSPALLAPLLLLQAAHVVAWGGLGHRTVAYLAERQFSAGTRSMVQDILGAAYFAAGNDISDVAVWADQIKNDSRYDWSKPLHYLGGGSSDPPLVCDLAQCAPAPGACAIRAITNTSSILASRTAGPGNDLTVEALKFLIHLVGDIHQPLHANNIRRGGNQIGVCFNATCGTNLHSVWDDAMPRVWNGLDPFLDNDALEKTVAKAWATRLHLQSQRMYHHEHASLQANECVDPAQKEKCPQAWALESNALVCSTVMWHSMSWVGDNDLFQSGYFNQAAPVMETRIRQAGNRLAAWMNALSATSSPSPVSEEL